ncbi:hypothetical protein V6N12_064865 [Hibiscus sabdariffa]|uniref:Uncharacterized protein n=1 Tax=Hibiscus sabdariffa TaxID=183260 RepID=A0ABR2G7J3_9ROSI
MYDYNHLMIGLWAYTNSSENIERTSQYHTERRSFCPPPTKALGSQYSTNLLEHQPCKRLPPKKPPHNKIRRGKRGRGKRRMTSNPSPQPFRPEPLRRIAFLITVARPGLEARPPQPKDQQTTKPCH